MIIINMKANIEKIVPKKVERDKGMVEKATIPSMEYLNKDQNDQLVSSSTLLTFSYSTHLVLKPTQVKIPLENLWYSFNSKIASTTGRVIKR